MACKPEPDPEGIGGFLALDEPVRVDVADAMGPAPLTGVVRAVNALGAAVPSAPRTLTVDGVDQEVSFDATGYGSWTVGAPGSTELWDLERGADWHAVGLDEAELARGLAASPPLGLASAVAGATGGMLVAVGPVLWWVSPDQSPHRVLDFGDEGEIEGIRALRIDADELLDAVVWTRTSVGLLRGRLGGGMWWAGAIQLEDLQVTGVSAGDINGDADADLVIAWDSPINQHILQVWQGNGLFDFDDWPEVRLYEAPGRVSVGQNLGDGVQQITVLKAEAEGWMRFQVAGDQILAIGPDITIPVDPASDTFGGHDLNQDGGDELFVFGGLQVGQPRNVRIYDLYEDDPNRVSFIDQSYPGAHLSLADGNGDGRMDLFALEDEGRLMSLAWTGSGYSQRRALTARDAGPFALTDIDADARPELLVAGAGWRWWPGSVRDTPEGQWWTADEPTVGRYPVALAGPMVGAPPSGGAMSVVGFAIRTGTLHLVRWKLTPPESPQNPPPISEVFSTSISTDTPLGLDLAVCGDVAWALMQGSLVQVNLVNGAVLGRLPTTATRVACGEGPQGAAGAILEAPTVRLLAADRSEIATESRPGAVDLAIGRQGAGTRLATCDLPDCRVEAWTWGSESSGFVIASSVGVQVQGADDTVILPGAGVPSVVDLGADGLMDLVTLEGSAVLGLFPSTGAGFGGGRFRHVGADLVGQVAVGDADGDGLGDFVAADAAGNLALVR